MLRRLIAQARAERRLRMRLRYPIPAQAHGARSDVRRRRRAAVLVERMLCASSADTIECGAFFGRLGTRLQMASAVITTMMTSVIKAEMGAAQARVLATVIAEVVRYAEESVATGGSICVYLVMAVEADRLVVAIGIDGDVNPVSTASATVAMLRARSIVKLMRGDFQRGSGGERVVFGLTFPAKTVRALTG